MNIDPMRMFVFDHPKDCKTFLIILSIKQEIQPKDFKPFMS